MKQICTTIFILLVFYSYSALAQQQSGLDFYYQAVKARKARQYEQAIQNYDFAIQREPKNHFYWYEKGLCEFLLRRYPAASKTLSSTIQLRNDYTPAYVLLAKIGIAEDNSKKIIDNLNLATKYESDNAKKINYKIVATSRLVRDGDLTQAHAQIKQAYQLSQEDSSAVYYYAKISNMVGKYADAEAALQKYIPKIAAQLPAVKAKYYYELGFAQFHQNQYEKAAASWKNAEFGVFKNRIERYSPKYFTAMALTYFRMYEDNLANHFVEKALAIEKDFPSAHVISVQLAKRKVDHSTTLPQLQNAVQHESSTIKKKESLMTISEYQFQLGRYEDAAKTLNELLAIDPDNQRAQLLRTLIPYHQQNYKAVIAATDAMIKKTTNAGEQLPFIFLQGLALKKVGQNESAIKTFRRLLNTPLAPAANYEIDIILGRTGHEEDFNLRLIDPPEDAK
ncbi:tetratricopeptide repeat protein [Rhodoflexus sp.]